MYSPLCLLKALVYDFLLCNTEHVIECVIVVVNPQKSLYSIAVLFHTVIVNVTTTRLLL